MGLEGVDMRLRQEITTDMGKAGATALPQTCLRSVGLKSKTVGNISRRDKRRRPVRACAKCWGASL